jgi:hypothetical protein
MSISSSSGAEASSVVPPSADDVVYDATVEMMLAVKADHHAETVYVLSVCDYRIFKVTFITFLSLYLITNSAVSVNLEVLTC